jgi:hypothetical protein
VWSVRTGAIQTTLSRIKFLACNPHRLVEPAIEGLLVGRMISTIRIEGLDDSQVQEDGITYSMRLVPKKHDCPHLVNRSCSKSLPCPTRNLFVTVFIFQRRVFMSIMVKENEEKKATGASVNPSLSLSDLTTK